MKNIFATIRLVIVEIFHSLQRNWKIFSATRKRFSNNFPSARVVSKEIFFSNFFPPASLMRAELKDGEILHSRLVLQINKSIIPLHADPTRNFKKA